MCDLWILRAFSYLIISWILQARHIQFLTFNLKQNKYGWIFYRQFQETSVPTEYFLSPFHNHTVTSKRRQSLGRSTASAGWFLQFEVSELQRTLRPRIRFLRVCVAGVGNKDCILWPQDSWRIEQYCEETTKWEKKSSAGLADLERRTFTLDTTREWNNLQSNDEVNNAGWCGQGMCKWTNWAWKGSTLSICTLGNACGITLCGITIWDNITFSGKSAGLRASLQE